VTVDKGEGLLNVEALDDKGNYRNFLNLQTVVVSPKGERQSVQLEQTGPGHYEVHFPTKEIGSYLLNLMDMKDGQVRGSQPVGASINYSPEFIAGGPNVNLLRRIAESGGGKMLEPGDLTINPFLHDRIKTFQPRELWEWLLRLAIILFTLDVAVRRVQIDRDEWDKWMTALKRKIFFWQPIPQKAETQESLGALLARRDTVRTQQTRPELKTTAHLFAPTKVPSELLPGQESPLSAETEPPPVATEPPAETEAPASTTSRLLDAKRRAQKRKP
jgi:hypothetical protein